MAASRRAPIATHTCLLTCMVVSAATAWQYCRFIQSGLWGSLDWALTSGGVCLTPVLGWFIHAGMLGDGNRCQGMGLWEMGQLKGTCQAKACVQELPQWVRCSLHCTGLVSRAMLRLAHWQVCSNCDNTAGGIWQQRVMPQDCQWQQQASDSSA